MKKLVLLSVLLMAISLVSGPLGLAAGEYTNTQLKYSISLPDGWYVSANMRLETFFGLRGADGPEPTSAPSLRAQGLPMIVSHTST